MKYMTSQEVLQQAALQSKQLGETYGVLQSELLKPLVGATVEILCQDDHGDFWWQLCEKPGCSYNVTHDSERYCYVHSRWYRRFLRPFNRLRTMIENKIERAIDTP